MNESSFVAERLWRLPAVLACLAVLMACSDQASDAAGASAINAADAPVAAPARQDGHSSSASAAEARSGGDVDERVFTEEAIAEQQQFGDEQLLALAEANIACSVLTAEDLAEVFGVEFSEGRFRWLETELRRAPASLKGICTFYATSLPPSTSPRSLFLRIYDSSPLVWELNRRDDQDHTQRFHHRPMESAPEIAERAYRRPQGADSFDATCADLGQHIACLWAHFHLTEDWVEKDVEIMSRLADRLAAVD
jgi:hypothetical protein